MDVTRYELTFPASNGGHDIFACVWRDPDCRHYRAVVQLVHGMAEYILRYEDFAVYLARRGYVVVGNDHAGHGLSTDGEKNRGCFGKRENSWLIWKKCWTSCRLTNKILFTPIAAQKKLREF